MTTYLIKPIQAIDLRQNESDGAILVELNGTIHADVIEADMNAISGEAPNSKTLYDLYNRLIAAPATEAKQDSILGAIEGIEDELDGTTSDGPLADIDTNAGATDDPAAAAGGEGSIAAKLRKMSADINTIDADTGNIATAVASGLPGSGEDVEGAADDSYATVLTSPARQCHYMHVAVGNGGARISLDGGTTVHYYIPANTERVFQGLVIPSEATIQGKKLSDGGTQYTNLRISIW